MILIDADTLNDTVEKFIAKFGEVYSEDLITGLRVCVYIAMQQPTQPEIIHCRDCKHWIPGFINDNDDFIPPKCGKYQQMVGHSADDYCNYAERREVSE